MPGISLNLKLIGAAKLIRTLNSSKTIKTPVSKGISKIALYYAGLAKKATVVDTGRLRSSISQQIGPTSATIGTNVKYASFVEYGTEKMTARHMEGAVKVLGKGGFTYALEQLKTWLRRGEHRIHKDIDAEFK
jgi:phage gpG-like protein